MNLAGTVWNFGPCGGYYGPLRFNTDGSTSGYQGCNERQWSEDQDGTINLWGDEKTVFRPTTCRARFGLFRGNHSAHWLKPVTNNSVTILGDGGLRLGDMVLMHNVWESLKNRTVYLRTGGNQMFILKEMGYDFRPGLDDDGLVINWEHMGRYSGRHKSMSFYDCYSGIVNGCVDDATQMAASILPHPVPDDPDKAYDFAVSNQHSGIIGGREVPREKWQQIIKLLLDRGHTIIDLNTIPRFDDAVRAMKRSRFLLSIDTVWQHLGVLYRIPSIILWNRRSWADWSWRYGGLGVQNIVFFEDIEKIGVVIDKMTGRHV